MYHMYRFTVKAKCDFACLNERSEIYRKLNIWNVYVCMIHPLGNTISML